MTLGTVVPLAVFAIALALLLLHQHREAFRHRAEERTLAVLSAVDFELQGSLTTVQALAVMHSLQAEDLRYFRAVAARVLESQPEWVNINVALPTGQQILNLHVPQGQPLPNIGTLDGSFERLVTERNAVVTDLAVEPVLKRWSFAVRAPVFSADGAMKYVVSAGVRPESLAAVLDAQRLPEGWVGVVLDRNNRIVARTLKPHESFGQLASQSLREGLARGSSGWLRGSTIEGAPVYTSYRRSDVTGWSFAMGIPVWAVDAAAWRTFTLLGAGVLAALSLAIAAAYFMSRRISSPIGELASGTDSLGRGETVRLAQQPRIAELSKLADTLRSSAQAIQDREKTIIREREALRASEERLRRERERLDLALTAGQMGAYDLDLIEERLWWSPQTYTLFRLSPETFVPTRASFGSLLHPEDRDSYWSALDKAIGERKPFMHEFRVVRADGTVLWIANRAQTEYDGNGRPLRHFGVALDITERKRVEQALRDADRQKDEFLAMLSHELRNPLAGLTSAAHVLKFAEPSSDPATKARRVVERQTKHMARLVGDLLDVSRVTFGKLTLDRERLDLGEAVARLVDVWKASGRFERHRVSLDVVTVWVNADRARIEQITANLLDNALKFTQAGKAVHISVAAEGGAAVLRMRDEGVGLAADAAGRVFDLFVSADKSAGLGMGLALVKRLTELHGGSVSVASAGAGKGSEFTVRLPTVDAATERESRDAVAAVGPRSVLLVEDNDDAREMLAALLLLQGHVVHVASDGETGLAIAGKEYPDLAVIDIRLPGMDGYEVARRLRASNNGRRIGLIALTGFGETHDQRRAFDAGFDAHLVKPVAAERMKQVIASLE